MTSQTVFEFFFNYLRFLGFLVYVSFAAALAAALEAAFLGKLDSIVVNDLCTLSEYRWFDPRLPANNV